MNNPLYLLALLLIAYGLGYVNGRYRRAAFENEGEALARRAILRMFPAENYHLMNDLTLPCEDGTTQIDHVLVSAKGVFVIESKHYTGWIFADARAKTWTRIKYRNKQKFQNPLRQNYKHFKAVRRAIALSGRRCEFIRTFNNLDANKFAPTASSSSSSFVKSKSCER